jgi:hypothetical protein
MNIGLFPSILMHILALYEHRGIVEAIAFMRTLGFTVPDAVDLLSQYDDIVANVKSVAPRQH